MRVSKWPILAGLLLTLAAGCGGTDTTVPADVATKVPTAPTPEKSAAGKPATAKRASVD